ncbi:MAG: CPBP family intramembrane glutamic endopeptidase [Verrucomicrobiota bacterium]
MRALRAVILYLLLVFIGGALLAPWLFYLVHALGFENLARNPFHRFVNRSIILMALIGLWPFLRSLGIKSWPDVGFTKSPQRLRLLGLGLLFGLVSLAMIALIVTGVGAREWNFDRTVPQIARHLANAILAAVMVSWIEELIFRGALVSAFRKEMGWVSAVLLSSAIYAWVHFFQRPPPPEQVHWFTGLVVFGEMMRGLVEWNLLVPAFFNLLLAGLILGLAFVRSGSLYFSIGLHAGWIFWLKSYGFFTRDTGAGINQLWGSGKLIDGWVAFAVLGVGFGMMLLCPARQAEVSVGK